MFKIFVVLFLFLSNVSFQKFSYNFDNKPEQLFLSDELTEISGLSFTKDGRLFGHNDEQGYLYQINQQDGSIEKSFYLGKELPLQDFEGLAIEGVNFYLVTSVGDIYLFYEQPDGKYSSYKKFSTGLDQSYNVEGLCFDPETFSLLLACKGNAKKLYKNEKAILSFNLKEKKLNKEPRFLIPEKELKERFGIKNFSPSGIERNPKTGNFFVISAKEKAIVELSKDGKIVNGSKLQDFYHNQPEGIAFDKDLTLFISDEGGNGKATISKYLVQD